MKLILIKQNGDKRKIDPDDVERASYRAADGMPRLLLHLKRGDSLTLLGDEARRVWALLSEFITGLEVAAHKNQP